MYPGSSPGPARAVAQVGQWLKIHKIIKWKSLTTFRQRKLAGAEAEGSPAASGAAGKVGLGDAACPQSQAWSALLRREDHGARMWFQFY